MSMDVNILAILIAALATFLIGGVWYGPLFEKVWMQESSFTTEGLKKRNMGMVFGLSFLAALISATLLEMFIGRSAELSFALLASLAVGLGWVACSFATVYLFEGRSLKLFLVNAGYHVVSFLAMGLILGLMN